MANMRDIFTLSLGAWQVWKFENTGGYSILLSHNVNYVNFYTDLARRSPTHTGRCVTQRFLLTCSKHFRKVFKEVPVKQERQNSVASATVNTVAVRLNKVLADAGVCSRRKADTLIGQGVVSVNGRRVSNLGECVVPGVDIITVNGRSLPTPQARCHLLLHKPVQVVCTVHDPEGRTTVVDILPEPWRSMRLYPVGRLDFFSEGLLILTDDGELAHRLAHPRYHLPKVYHVLVREAVPDTALTVMRRGMSLAEGERLAPVEVKALPSSRGTLLEMTLRQGLNRQIRRMCRDLGLTILTLSRVAQGPLQLGDLPCGKARSLSSKELAALRAAVGLK